MNKVLFIALVLLAAPNSYAQDSGGSGHNPQLGVFIGRALPHGISATDNIFTLWGARYSQPMGKPEKAGGGSFVDLSFIGGNGSEVHWGGVGLDASMQAPFETLIASVGLGIDFTQYSSDTASTKYVFGEHFLGSVMSRIGDSAMLRFDMKFNANPGTTVFFGIGVVFEFNGSSGGGGA